MSNSNEALAKDLASRIVSMARERDSTCELRYDEAEVLKEAETDLLTAFSQLVEADICECCGKQLTNGDCASCANDEAKGREFAARTGMVMPPENVR